MQSRQARSRSSILIGRDDEQHSLLELLSPARVMGHSLLLEGDAGIGKSALLQATELAAIERGFWVLRCAGLENASPAGYEGLGELLRPLLPYASTLPTRQRHALLAAVGLESGPASDPLLVALGALSLLEDAASRQPVFVSIEDAHWLDASSGYVLAFVAQRIAQSRVVLIAAVRTPHRTILTEGAGWQRLALEPLSDQNAQLLLDTVAADLSPVIRTRILAEAVGNPLALREFPTAVRSLGAAGVGALPVTDKLQRAYLHQLETVPARSRSFLLLAAAGLDIGLPDLLAAGRRLGLGLDDLLPLESAGLLLVSETSLRLRHPLLRAVICAAAPASELLSTHAALAATATDPVRAAWHRASAGTGPDEAVAENLEAASRTARARGALPEVVTLLERAAELSPTGAAQVRRFALAAASARQAGLVASAQDLLARAGDGGQADSFTLTELATTRLMLGLSSVEGALQPSREILELSARLREPHDVQRRLRVLFSVALAARLRGLEPGQVQRLEAELASIDTSDPLKPIALAFLAPLGQQPSLRPLLPALLSPLQHFPLGVMALGLAAVAVQDLDLAERCWNLCVEKFRESGAVVDEALALRARANILLLRGNLPDALGDAEQARRMCEEKQQFVLASEAWALLARIHALSGEDAAAAQAVRRARQLGGPIASLLASADASWAAGVVAMRQGDHRAALSELMAAGLYPEGRMWAISDRTEAAVRAGRPDTVRTALEEAGLVAAAYPSAYLIMLVQRSRALLAAADGQPDAEKHFEAALRLGVDSGSALELARTRLLRGEWLRTERRREEAREDLAAALAEFRSLGANPLAERAAEALRATGLASPGAGSEAGPAQRLAELTAQELQIARLAATGMSNKEIADQVYLSHRTVAAHLYRIFPKLGITRRTQLSGALGARD